MTEIQLPKLHQRVCMRRDLVDDHTEDGMGIEVLCRRGDIVVVRRIVHRRIYVVHEYMPPGKMFRVTVDEINYPYDPKVEP